jgi:ATP/maltotriose-dependent transcriptional regulator MalT/DNA-binding SARP family transcriptional activator
VWVAAPPGAGKTTLAATYLDAVPAAVLWYQVDAGDGDPAAFFYYLGLAAAQLSPHARLPLLLPEHLSDLTGFTRRFFRRLFSSLPEGAVLVLDNFQEADEAQLAPVVLAASAEVPHGSNILVLSRCDPPSGFAELVAREDLCVLDWDSLRLTLDETRAMSALKGISEEWLVRALHQESGGWAAGVTLMLERLKRAGSGEGALLRDTRESVFDYFATLMFDQATGSVRTTLLSLAFLPRVTLSTAHELSGNEEAGKLLEGMRRRHLFVDRRPGQEPVYQFHALFATFLQTKAQELLAPEELRAQLRAACDALDRQGEWEAAFELAGKVQAWDRAAALILSHAPALLSSGRWQTLTQWIEKLPIGPARDAWVEYWHACATAQRDPRAAVRIYELAHERFLQRGERTGRVLSLAGLMHACSIDHTDYRTMDRWLDQLNALLNEAGHLAPEHELAARGALLFGAFFVRPWHPCIEPCLERVEALLGSVDDRDAALRAAISALTVASQSCQLDRSRRLGAAVLSLATRQDATPVLAAWGLFQLAHQRFLMLADYEESMRCFEQVWSLAEANGLGQVLTSTLTHRFMIDFRLGSRAAAEASMQAIEALPPAEHPLSRGLLMCYRARLAQVRGQPQAAGELAVQSDAFILKTGAAWHEMIYGLINGEILLAAGRPAHAAPLIARARSVVERSPLLANLTPVVALVEAWLAEQQGYEAQSLRLLHEALRRSERDHGWCQMRFVDTTCAHMLRVALKCNIEPDAAKRLIRTFRLKPQDTDDQAWPWPLRVYVLGRFEVLIDDRALVFERKSPKKALALLKALIALGPREVVEEQLVDALWRDEEGDAGHKALSVTVLRLRRLLGDNDLIRHQAGRLCIDREKCWIDAWAFERLLATMPYQGPLEPSSAAALEKILALYEGALLPEDAGEPWTVSARERLRGKFVQALAGLGRQLEAAGCQDDAIAWYLKGLEADPIVEPFYQGLMRCYEALDRRSEAVAAYRRLKHTLSVTLGLAPSASSEKLYQSLRAVS